MNKTYKTFIFRWRNLNNGVLSTLLASFSTNYREIT